MTGRESLGLELAALVRREPAAEVPDAATIRRDGAVAVGDVGDGLARLGADEASGGAVGLHGTAEPDVYVGRLAARCDLDRFGLRLVGRFGIEGAPVELAAAEADRAVVAVLPDAHVIAARRQAVDAIDAAVVRRVVARVGGAAHHRLHRLLVLVGGHDRDALGDDGVTVGVRDAPRDDAAALQPEVNVLD